jgi:hypothetical protein
MNKQNQQTSRAFLVFSDIFATYIFPALLVSAHFLLLFGYGLLWSQYTGTIPKDHAGLIAAVLMINLYVFLEALQMGQCTPHLRTSPAAFKKYLGQFMCVLVVSCFIAVVPHLVLSLIALPFLPLYPIPGFFTKHLCLTALCCLLEWAILHRLAHRTFLQMPMPEEPSELVRGHDLASAEDIEWRAWTDV